MKKAIFSIIISLFLSVVLHAQKSGGEKHDASLPNYYENSSTLIIDDRVYEVEVWESKGEPHRVRVDIKEENSDLVFYARFKDSGDIQEWSPRPSLKNIQSAADVIRDVFPLEDRTNFVSDNFLTFVFRVSTDSGKIEATKFFIVMENGVDRPLCSIPPSTIFEIEKRFAEVLEFDITEENKKYDSLVCSISIMFGPDGKVLVRKPDSMYIHSFEEY